MTTSDPIPYATAADGWRIALREFAPAHGAGGGNRPPRPIVVMLPAMGAHAGSLAQMGSYLAERGYPAIAVDPRGTGASLPHPQRGVDYGLADHIESDLPAVLNWARARYGDRPVILLGHSLGGHIAAVYAGLAPRQVAGLVLLTTSHLHYRNFGARSLVIFLGFRAVAKILGYLPGQHFGWGRPIARQVVVDWSGWALTGRFRFADGRDLEPVLARACHPLLAISFADDLRMSPRHAVDRFVDLMPGARTTRWHLSPAELDRDRIGHMGHLRDCPMLWERIADWLDAGF